MWSPVSDDEEQGQREAAGTSQVATAVDGQRQRQRVPFTLYDADPGGDEKKKKGGKGKGNKGSDSD